MRIGGFEVLDARLQWTVAAADDSVVRTWQGEDLAVVYACRQRTTHLIDAEVVSILQRLGSGPCSVGELAQDGATDLSIDTRSLDELVQILQALQSAGLLVLQPC